MGIDEVEHGVVSGFPMQEGNAADTQAWIPALEQHEALFEQPPWLATADRGFFSAENEREAKARGVEKVALRAGRRMYVAGPKTELVSGVSISSYPPPWVVLCEPGCSWLAQILAEA